MTILKASDNSADKNDVLYCTSVSHILSITKKTVTGFHSFEGFKLKAGWLIVMKLFI